MRSRTLAWLGLACLAVASALGAVIVFGFGHVPALDSGWNALVAAVRTPWMLSVSLILDHIGGGWVAVLAVPLLVIIALCIARRWRAAVFAAVSFAASALGVQVLKNLFGRARPDDMLVASDFGSFPSGHTANATTIAMVLWLLFPLTRVAVLGIVWVVAMALSRTLLSVHWATDTVGGVLVGLAASLLIGAALLPWVRGGAPDRVERDAGSGDAELDEERDAEGPSVSP